MIKFNEFIFSRYRYGKDGQNIIPLSKLSLEKRLYIPLSKISKFFLRLCVLETDFYRHLTRDLTNIDGFGPYKILILILYFSIQIKSLKSYVEKKLYRRALMSKNEMDEIIEIINLKKRNI